MIRIVKDYNLNTLDYSYTIFWDDYKIEEPFFINYLNIIRFDESINSTYFMLQYHNNYPSKDILTYKSHLAYCINDIIRISQKHGYSKAKSILDFVSREIAKEYVYTLRKDRNDSK